MEAMFKWHGTHQLPNGAITGTFNSSLASACNMAFSCSQLGAVSLTTWQPFFVSLGWFGCSLWKKNMLIKCLGNFWIWKIEHPKRNSCLFIQQPYNYWKMMEGKCYAGFGQCQKHHPVVSVAWLCKKNCFLIFLVKWTVSLMMHSRCIKKTKYIYIYTSIYEKMRIDPSSHWWYSFN